MLFVVAGHASLREDGLLTCFILMRIMTGQAGHLTILETFAGGQPSILVAVDVEIGDVFNGGGIDREKIAQLVTRLEREGRL
jgi:hypothetical protein